MHTSRKVSKDDVGTVHSGCFRIWLMIYEYHVSKGIVTHLTHDLPSFKELVLLVFGENHGSELRCPEIARESDLPFSIVYHLLEIFGLWRVTDVLGFNQVQPLVAWRFWLQDHWTVFPGSDFVFQLIIDSHFVLDFVRQLLRLQRQLEQLWVPLQHASGSTMVR